jgi:hypothetical protein
MTNSNHTSWEQPSCQEMLYGSDPLLQRSQCQPTPLFWDVVRKGRIEHSCATKKCRASCLHCLACDGCIFSTATSSHYFPECFRTRCNHDLVTIGAYDYASAETNPRLRRCIG